MSGKSARDRKRRKRNQTEIPQLNSSINIFKSTVKNFSNKMRQIEKKIISKFDDRYFEISE